METVTYSTKEWYFIINVIRIKAARPINVVGQDTGPSVPGPCTGFTSLVQHEPFPSTHIRQTQT